MEVKRRPPPNWKKVERLTHAERARRRQFDSLVKGGQGRTAREVLDLAGALVFFAVVLVVGALVFAICRGLLYWW